MNDLQFGSYALIPHKSENQLLTISGKLPYFATTERHYWQDVQFVNSAVREAFGIEATTLCCLSTDFNTDAQVVMAAYAMENHTPALELPPGSAWLGNQDIRQLDPADRAIAAQWFDWVKSRSALRVPWYRSNWQQEVRQWIAERLKSLGYPEIRSIEQIRSWGRSAVVRVTTLAGAAYFKAVPTMFRHEPKLTQWLAQGYPRRFPRVLAVDDAHHWMLMRDFGSETLDRVPDIAAWEDAMRRFGKLQVELASESEVLLGLSIPDRRLEKIAEDIEPLFADQAAMLYGQDVGLSGEDIQQLNQLVPRLQAMCEELAEIGLPWSLEHGDFYASQVAVFEGQYLFFDWSDASLSHPFFSLASMIDYMDEMRPDMSDDEQTRIIEAYLEAWHPYALPDQLVQAVALAMPLYALHCAILYHKYILPWMEIKWEMERMIPFYLKKLLARMRS